MSDPFAMFASDVKAAVPGSPGEAKQENAFDTFAASSPPPQQPTMNVQPQMMGSGAIGSPIGHMPPMNQNALVPTNSPANPYSQQPQPPLSPGSEAANPFAAPPAATANPFGAPVSPAAAPFGAPASPTANPFDAPVSPVPQPGAPPFAVPPSSAPPVLPPSPAAGAITPYAMPPSSAPPVLPPEPAADPWGAPPVPQQQQQLVQAADPWGAPQVPQQQPPAAEADPLAMFSSAPPAAAPPVAAEQTAPAAQTSALPSAEDDMWADMGFSAPSAPAPATSTTRGVLNNKELPPGGEYYDVKIFTPSLGIVFFRPQQLKDSLFLETDKAIIDGLGTRPVVSHILEGSSASAANIEIGHVLLKVNDIEVYSPEEAVHLIKKSKRPLPLLFYVPETEVVLAEGEHMVKYDSQDVTAPLSPDSWKSKYVVVGGIISKPWLINMYRSKEEYDIAIMETQSNRKLSVKVKQFSLIALSLAKDGPIKEDGGPDPAIQSVKYRQKLYPWRYFVILPRKGDKIKISSSGADALAPVLAGVRRVLKEYGAGTKAAQRALYKYTESSPSYPPRPVGAGPGMAPYSYGEQLPVVKQVDAYGGDLQKVESY